MKKKICKICLKKYEPLFPLQRVCGIKCAIKLSRRKSKKNHARIIKTVKPDKLRRKADSRFQTVGRKMYPKSIISGAETQVIHHFIYKSRSNATRYDLEDNAIPLTVIEHDAIHNKTIKSELELEICIKKGQEWQKRLLEKSKKIVKLTNNYLEEVIDKMESI